MAKFAAFVTAARELADLLKAEFSLDPTASLEQRAQVASYTVAWQAAQTRVKGQADAEANNEIRDLAKPIPVSDYMAMRQSFSKAFGELEDKYIPSKEYIEKKLNELESGEFRAEQLSEVVGRDEVDPDTLLPSWDSKGHITVKKASSTASGASVAKFCLCQAKTRARSVFAFRGGSCDDFFPFVPETWFV